MKSTSWNIKNEQFANASIAVSVPFYRLKSDATTMRALTVNTFHNDCIKDLLLNKARGIIH